MKNYFFRSTAIFILILSLGVGQIWANTTRHPVYCAIRPSSLGETGELYLNVNKGKSFDGGDWYRVKMDKIATTIHKASTGETKDLYVASIEYVEVGLQQMEFQIYDAAPPAPPRETHMAFDSWTTNSDTWTKQVFDYENNNFTTYPASLTQKKSYVYFDAADWNDNVKQLVISHGTYRGFNDLNHLSNTTLYYANPELNWGDAVCISFIGNSTSWSETGKWLNDIPIWSLHYTGYLHYSLQENSFNYFARRSGDEKGAALSYNYWGTENTAYQNLNKTQTVQARVKTTGSSYSDVSFASWPGSVSAKRTYMSSATATTSPSAANMTSATTDAVLTSSITLTASANSGYYFEGWGDASDSNPTDGTTAKTYSVTDTKTSYAFFSQTYTLTYDRKGNYSTSTLSVYSVDNFSGTTTSGSSIPTGHLITLVATPATGYEVEGWFSDAACTSPYTNGSGGVTIEGNTFKLASLNANTEVYCKFRPITYTIRLEGMEADGGNDPIDVEVAYDAVLRPLEKKHTKAHYDLLGYWAASDDHGMNKTKRLIDENGNWIPDVEGYTGKDGEGRPTWRYADRNISLFADWKEIKHTVAIAVSPADAGVVQISGANITEVTNVGFATKSDEMTPVANAGWVFKEWQVSSGNLKMDLENYHSDYQKEGTNAMKVNATADGQTLTAVFTYRSSIKGTMNGEDWKIDHFVANIETTGGKVIGYVDIDLPANTSYEFAIYDLQEIQWLKNGSNQVSFMANGDSYNWSFATDKAYNCGITTAGAGTYRFMWNITDKTMSVIYPNFVIYRTGDQGEDSESATHTITSPVESYVGGTISEAIEFRMKVRELDKWYSLSLPFEVNKVCVWDPEDGAYYDIVPYYRTDGKFYTGHYIIRKPVTTYDFAIEGFEGRDRWIDPENSGVRPKKNIPYIIQWHDQYFRGKYISFFGDTNQDIPSNFDAGYEPSENDVVNIFGNNTMHSGTVRDAYLLDKDYGPSGAWLREAIGTDRTIRPFECFILANTATTTRYRILRRGMEETDTPTALEQISNHQSPMTIRVYTITGVLIGEYNDCSFQDAAHRIATDHNEGIYILRSENESMKLLLGGK